jgi:hypothetical protein
MFARVMVMTSDQHDRHGVSRRKILDCMTRAGIGVLWTVAAGVPSRDEIVAAYLNR